MSITNMKIFFVVLIASCGVSRDEKIQTRNILDNIVLVNGGVYNRCQMADLIQVISKCKPKVIGIDFFFIGENHDKCDLLLKTAIVDSKKVVLSEGFENGVHVESDQLFSNYAMLTGVTGLVQNQDGVVESYLRVTDNAGRWTYSFPFHLALQYDTAMASGLAAKSPSKLYPINVTHGLKDFKVINDATTISSTCDLLEGKIIIIGYLGPGDEDIYRARITNTSSEKIYGVLIIANVIVDILSEI